MRIKITAIAIVLAATTSLLFADGPWSAVQNTTTFRTNDFFCLDQPDLSTNAVISGANLQAQLTAGLMTTQSVVAAVQGNNSLLGSFSGNGAGMTGFPVSSIANIGYTNIYRATLTQSGSSAPAANVMQSTFKTLPTWIRIGAGVYAVSVPGTFSTNKTFVQIDGLPTFNSAAEVTSISSDYIVIETFINDSFISSVDGVLGSGAPTSFEIIQFP